MNDSDSKYNAFALCREMLQTPDVIRSFDPAITARAAESVAEAGRLFMTGEGSSRIFPAKNAIRRSLQWGTQLHPATDGSRQSATYDLGDFAVFAASNSGRTKEVVGLLQELAAGGHERLFGISARQDNLLAEHTAETFVLTCGWEEAVAATKSVVEQALIYQSLVSHVAGQDMPSLSAAADAVETALTMDIDAAIVDRAGEGGTIYFAGYNDGVAEELTLKTNEIARRKSDFLEGTYAVHGIEEVMDRSDTIVVIEPFMAELGKFREVLVDGVGCEVICIATEKTDLPTIVVPDVGDLSGCVYLAAGWNLLVELGLAAGIDLDKPQRARKVGNEVEGE
ncbi:MAG: sugar isomerase [Planctomycetes bacterium]|jgi:glucosamine--fructose-6-phosphate aminotransferase (isomerizing)|nr:sugar isomerase [Phycisphaerae bacterium]NBB95812.1 sugar isomerase [Planctomycetota bacterium]